MSIVETMTESARKSWSVPFHLTRNGEPGDPFKRLIEDALRSVKPEDITDGMVQAACNAIHPAKWADKREAEMRRAIAAAIAAGAEP